MDDKQWDVQEDLIESYKLYCSFLYEKTVDIQEVDDWTIMVTLDDGSKYLYYSDTHVFRTLPKDPDDITEAECRREFSRRLSRIMLYKGVTQEMLAERTGMSQSRISEYVNGKHTPSFYITDKIAKALGCSMDQLRYYN